MLVTRHTLAALGIVGALAGCGEAPPGGPAPQGQVEAGDSAADRRLGYAVGYQIGERLRADGVAVEPEAVARGLGDALRGATPELSALEREEVLDGFRTARLSGGPAESARNREEAAVFLAANRNNPDVVELPSGLQYRELRAGNGRTPRPTDRVRVHYRGTLLDGTEFDSSYGRGEPTELAVDQVIEGWQQALTRMREGARWQVVVPPELGYGEAGAGGVIGPGETLLFEIELIKVESQGGDN
jgi:FKBP-type peptidyl-prolyl cis-trans isomerase FklB